MVNMQPALRLVGILLMCLVVSFSQDSSSEAPLNETTLDDAAAGNSSSTTDGAEDSFINGTIINGTDVSALNGTIDDDNSTEIAVVDDDGLLPPIEVIRNSSSSVLNNETIDFEETHWQLTCSFDNAAGIGCGLGDYCSFNTGDRNTSACVRCPADHDLSKCNSSGYSQEAIDDCWYLCYFADIGEACSDKLICWPGQYCHHAGEENNTLGDCRECPNTPEQCLELAQGNERTLERCLECELLCVSVFTIEIDGIEHPSIPVDGSPYLNVSGPLVNCTDLRSPLVDVCPYATNSICMVEDFNDPVYYLEVALKCQESGGIGMLILNNNIYQYPFIAYGLTSIPSAGIMLDDSNATDMAYLSETLGKVVSFTTEGQFCYIEQTCSAELPCVGWLAGEYCSDGHCAACPVNNATGENDPFLCFFEEDDRKDWQHTADSIKSCAQVCGSELRFGQCKFCPDTITAFEFGVESEDDRCYFCPANDVKYPQRELRMFHDAECWQVQEFFRTVEVQKDTTNCELAQTMNYICGCEGPGYAGAGTETERAVLAWVPRVMAILSILGSGFIVIDATASAKKRRKLSNKLLVTLSVFDIMGSVAYALTTLPIPATDYIYGAYGTTTSCTAQGFFIQMGTVSCYINVSLSVYYLLVIKFGWTPLRLEKYSTILLVVPIVVGLIFAFAGIPFYDSVFLWCNNAAPYWPDVGVAIAIAVATVVMIIVCVDVYIKERASDRWRVSSATGSTGQFSSRSNAPASVTTFFHIRNRRNTTASGSSLDAAGSVQPGGRSASLTDSTAYVAGRQRSGSNDSMEYSGHAARGPSDSLGHHVRVARRPRARLSRKVFSQCFFYLLAFYLTWPPYLALQYAWASGRSFSNYGLILTAGILVPLQGFWNFLVYGRSRYFASKEGVGSSWFAWIFRGRSNTGSNALPSSNGGTVSKTVSQTNTHTGTGALAVVGEHTSFRTMGDHPSQEQALTTPSSMLDMGGGGPGRSSFAEDESTEAKLKDWMAKLNPSPSFRKEEKGESAAPSESLPEDADTEPAHDGTEEAPANSPPAPAAGSTEEPQKSNQQKEHPSVADDKEESLQGFPEGCATITSREEGASRLTL